MPRVILLSLDTLRADHLGLYGYPRPTSPNLEKLARRSVTFTSASATSPFTLPSHMSMITGMGPRAHGVLTPADRLRERYLTIAELLHDVGYRTEAFTDGGLLSAEYGFDQGFDAYRDDRADGGQRNNGFRRFGEDLERWIEDHRQGPFFLFVHTFDTHGPYVTGTEEARRALAGTEPVVPEAAREDPGVMDYLRSLHVHDYLELGRVGSIRELIDDYDAAIRTADAWVGRILDLLEREGILEDTLWIVTSDHGESFYDHRLYVGHGILTYENEIHVPLVVHFPRDRFAGERCDDPVSLVDFFPTIAEAAEIHWPATVQGVDLAAVVGSRAPRPRPIAGTSPHLEGSLFLRTGSMKFLQAPRVSLEHLLLRHLHRPEEGEEGYDLAADPLGLRDRFPGEDQLYDLSLDPGETRNLVEERPAVADQAREELRRCERDDYLLREIHRGDGVLPVLDEQTIETLHELGYLSQTEMRRQIRDLRQERHDAWREKMRGARGGG